MESDKKVKLVSMNFVVTEKFRKTYKTYAAFTSRTMSEILTESFKKLTEDERAKKESADQSKDS